MATIRQGIYDLLNAVEIDTKEEGRIHVEPWPSQRMVIDAVCRGLNEDVHEFVVLKCRQVACCLIPDTLVLTANLRWVPIGTIKPGDDLVAFDENPPGGKGSGRRMRTATAVATVRMKSPVYEIHFDDGRSVVCTGNHPWLSRKESTEWKWRSLTRTKRGGRNGGNILTVGAKVRTICRPWGAPDYEDGWFSGLLDGEGSISGVKHAGCRVLVTQSPGAVLDRAMAYAANKGFHYSIDNDLTYIRQGKLGDKPCPRLVFCRMDEVFQILGQLRPSRLFARRFWEDREIPNAPFATIVSIVPAGEYEVVDLQTTTGTYVAEGFASHNTTVCSVIELFWALANPGVQGAIIADRTDNLERLRRIFASLLETLPDEWKGPEHRLITNNRNGMAFANKSVIDLLAAASNPDLGASRALNMAHMTECSLWRSLPGVESLKASLARQNPHRLYIWESIANGFNWFYNHWQQAKQDRHMRAVFCGFWSNPLYAIQKTDPDFRVYWDNKVTDEEIVKARYVKEHYKVTVKPEQIAWWRRESEFKDQEFMLRHYPWTEKECFIASGSGFFPAQRTLEISESLSPVSPPYQGYKYLFDEQFLKSSIVQVNNAEDAMLKVWEPPEAGGVYVIGVDPSGGGGGESNDHAIEVLRCYSDRVVQVAEFQTNKPLTYQLAWVLAHLAGAYRDHITNLEVSGVGAAVLPEVRNLRQLAERGILQGHPEGQKILDMIGAVRWFLYRRADTLGGAGNVIAWKTNQDNKHMIYSELRDSLMLRRLEIRSPKLVTQLQSIVEDEGWLGAGPDTGENDDLVAAVTFAHHAYVEWRRPMLVARNLTWDSVKGERPPQNMGTMLSFAFSEKIAQINRTASIRREKF